MYVYLRLRSPRAILPVKVALLQRDNSCSGKLCGKNPASVGQKQLREGRLKHKANEVLLIITFHFQSRRDVTSGSKASKGLAQDCHP